MGEEEQRLGYKVGGLLVESMLSMRFELSLKFFIVLKVQT